MQLDGVKQFAGEDSKVEVAQEKDAVQTPKRDDRICESVLSPSESWVVTPLKDGPIKVWSVETGLKWNQAFVKKPVVLTNRFGLVEFQERLRKHLRKVVKVDAQECTSRAKERCWLHTPNKLVFLPHTHSRLADVLCRHVR